MTSALAIEEKAALYYDRGFANYSMKTPESLQAAVSDFTKAEEKGMNTEQLFNSRAVCNKALKNFAQEAQDYTKLLEINANNEKYYYNRGVALFKADKFQEALADFSKAIELKPDYVNAYKY
ncbi:MAG: tetratricopeptide repeat protein, partial [Bacteroidales bacterium]|nr:tetratricopeptide repeat protein [Bacteroidales bacterium]